MKNRKIYGGFFCLSCFLILACQGVVNDPAPGGEGTALIRIAIQGVRGAAARTVLPGVSLTEITRYELWGDSGGGEILLGSFTDSSGATVSIGKGTWNFTLKAFQDDRILLEGTARNTVIPASGDTLYFTLMPLAGPGAIRIEITFPANAGIASATAVQGETEETLSASGNSIVYEKSGVASGEYFISFRLKDADGVVLAVYSELVLVGANLTSAKTFTLTEEDLKFTSLVPAELLAVPLDEKAIQLSWSPVAGAASYRVYRSDAADGNFTVAGDSDGLSYTDSSAAAEETWYYKVSALNSGGAESFPSEAVSGTVPLKITSFSFAGPAAAGVIDGTAITIAVPLLVYMSSLTPSISHTGSSISPDPSLAQDFSGPVQYSITAPNGTVKDYTVTVNAVDDSLLGSLNWLADNAADGGEYVINLQQDQETLDPRSLSFAGNSGVQITINGGDREKTIGLNRTGALFTLGAGVSLTLNGAVTMTGLTGNDSAVVTVDSGGVLTMNSGVKITGNVNSGNGGGVSVAGTFTMQGGEIGGNSAQDGGGVYVSSGGAFTKTGGVIFGSDAAAASKNTALGSGSAVYAGENKIRNYSADAAVIIDSGQSGMAGGFEGPAAITVRNNLLNDWDLLTQDQTVEPGSSTPFTVNGNYATYQWYVDGIPDGNAPVYTFNAADGRAEGVYELTVRVTDAAGEERSGRRRVTVRKANLPVSSPLEVTLNLPGDWDLLPQNREITGNTAVLFTVAGTYSSYQWYLDGGPVGTDADYSFDPAGKQGVYELAVVVTGANGEQRAGRCRIAINDPDLANFKLQTAAITLQVDAPSEWETLPQSRVVPGNGATQFTVEGTYSSYRWYLDGGHVGTDAGYSFDPAGTQGGEVYELAVVVPGANGEQRSGRCRITIQK
jgi:hypothetical protein